MISKVQNCIAFGGVFVRKNSQTEKNIKEVIDVVESREYCDETNLRFNESTRIKDAFNNGLKDLNDGFIDDDETRYLKLTAEYDSFTGLPFGYELGIENEDGSLFASGYANISSACASALRFAFENLKIDYEYNLTKQAIERYSQISSLDTTSEN